MINPIKITPMHEQDGESKFLAVSVRAWLAMMLIGTVCIIYLAEGIAKTYLMLKSGQPVDMKISEPLYTLVVMGVSFYLGNKDKPANGKPTIPQSTDTTTLLKP